RHARRLGPIPQGHDRLLDHRSRHEPAAWPEPGGRPRPLLLGPGSSLRRLSTAGHPQLQRRGQRQRLLTPGRVGETPPIPIIVKKNSGGFHPPDDQRPHATDLPSWPNPATIATRSNGSPRSSSSGTAAASTRP